MKQTAFIPVLMSMALWMPAAAQGGAPATPPTPDAFLGFPLGADRRLADYRQIVEYFKILDEASPRLTLHSLGRTTLGADFVMAAISTPRNLEQASLHRERAHRLADPRGVSRDEVERIIREGPAIVLVTCNIHSTEIAASQMAMELAHRLVTTEDARILGHLDDVILLLVPSLNPDGQIMEVEWYRKNLGTPFEGGRMPWLYHHYAGHDNNRDFFMLALEETRMINRVLYHDWFPQIYLDEHQMGSTGPRLFVPPFVDPLNPNIPALLWRMTALIGSNMALREELAGKAGVIDRYSYDGYWPGGSMNTSFWKNTVGVLTEMASAKMATPVYVDEGELSGDRKGLPEYKAQMSFPNPWRGGWWRLRDIMDYELIATLSLIETASRHREDFLRGMWASATAMIEAGRGAPPYAYVVPTGQHDPPTAALMIDILRENGVETYQTSRPVPAGGRTWPAGSVFILMDQPYRAFVKEMLERQVYPEIRPSSDAAILKPYDVTGWTLPLQMGVTWSPIEEPLGDEARSALVKMTGPPAADPGTLGIAGGERADARYYAIPHRTNAASRAINRLLKAGRAVYLSAVPFVAEGRSFEAGTILVPAGSSAAPDVRQAASELAIAPVALGGVWTAGAPLDVRRLRSPRVGLYKPWAASMDEGWTRLVLERAEFPYLSLDNAALKAGGLRGKFDVIILPDVEKEIIVDGKPKPADPTARYFVPLPDEYAGGIGPEGVKALKGFVNEGGTLVALDSSSMLPIEEFNIPVRNVLEGLKTDVYNCPGSLIRVLVDPNHPVGYGMPAETAAYVAQGPAFATSIPGAGQDRAVIARYPEEGDLLLSGWIQGEDLLRRRAAAVEVAMGKGRVILFGIRVQHRSQTHGTYKLLFNAIHYGASEPARLP
ncbi:MAG TPA: M14 metallopeptidase family protein [Candidatus Polarisedimenticolia bacterium]|jgi:hypothetical protein